MPTARAVPVARGKDGMANDQQSKVLKGADIERQAASLKQAAKTTPFVISAVSGYGVDGALRALLQFIDKAREDTTASRADVVWQP